jgi:hypothetical protein
LLLIDHILFQIFSRNMLLKHKQNALCTTQRAAPKPVTFNVGCALALLVLSPFKLGLQSILEGDVVGLRLSEAKDRILLPALRVILPRYPSRQSRCLLHWVVASGNWSYAVLVDQNVYDS